MFRKIFICCFLFYSLLAIESCKPDINKTIEGVWIVDTIYFKGYDIKPCLLSNMIIFNEDNKSSLCETGKSCGEEIVGRSKVPFGLWEIIQSSNKNDTFPLSIKFTTDNEIFAGTHKLVFYNDRSKRLLKIEIYSDSLYIVCGKAQYNYDRNYDLMNELEKLSWSTRPKILTNDR